MINIINMTKMKIDNDETCENDAIDGNYEHNEPVEDDEK